MSKSNKKTKRSGTVPSKNLSRGAPLGFDTSAGRVGPSQQKPGTVSLSAAMQRSGETKEQVAFWLDVFPSWAGVPPTYQAVQGLVNKVMALEKDGAPLSLSDRPGFWAQNLWNDTTIFLVQQLARGSKHRDLRKTIQLVSRFSGQNDLIVRARQCLAGEIETYRGLLSRLARSNGDRRMLDEELRAPDLTEEEREVAEALRARDRAFDSFQGVVKNGRKAIQAKIEEVQEVLKRLQAVEREVISSVPGLATNIGNYNEVRKRVLSSAEESAALQHFRECQLSKTGQTPPVYLKKVLEDLKAQEASVARDGCLNALSRACVTEGALSLRFQEGVQRAFRGSKDLSETQRRQLSVGNKGSPVLGGGLAGALGRAAGVPAAIHADPSGEAEAYTDFEFEDELGMGEDE